MYCHLRHQYRNDYLASSTAANTIPIHEAALQDTELLRTIISGIEFHLRLKSSCIKDRGGRRRFFALASAQPKKERESAMKKSAKKSESAERERKKARIRAFSSLQN